MQKKTLHFFILTILSFFYMSAVQAHYLFPIKIHSISDYIMYPELDKLVIDGSQEHINFLSNDISMIPCILQRTKLLDRYLYENKSSIESLKVDFFSRYISSNIDGGKPIGCLAVDDLSRYISSNIDAVKPIGWLKVDDLNKNKIFDFAIKIPFDIDFGPPAEEVGNLLISGKMDIIGKVIFDTTAGVSLEIKQVHTKVECADDKIKCVPLEFTCKDGKDIVINITDNDINHMQN